MKKMRQIVCCAIIVLIICIAVAAHAEEAELNEADSLSNEILLAANAVTGWEIKLGDASSRCEDDDVQVLLTHILELMPTYESTIVMPDSNPSNITLQGDMQPRQIAADIDGKLLAVHNGYTYLDYLDRYGTSDVAYSDHFCRVEYTEYTSQGIFNGVQKLELAQRENGEILVLFIDYDTEYQATGRYLAWIDDIDEKCIYTKTFGQIMDVTMNVEEWSEGNEPLEWSNELLWELK